MEQLKCIVSYIVGKDPYDDSGGGSQLEYPGPYEITPKVYSGVTLLTKSLYMKENVLIHKIPQYEVSNEAGGKTFIVGDEYYG